MLPHEGAMISASACHTDARCGAKDRARRIDMFRKLQVTLRKWYTGGIYVQRPLKNSVSLSVPLLLQCCWLHYRAENRGDQQLFQNIKNYQKTYEITKLLFDWREQRVQVRRFTRARTGSRVFSSTCSREISPVLIWRICSERGRKPRISSPSQAFRIRS